MNALVKAAAVERDIKRLCHLTPFSNLVHIASGEGLLSTAQLGAQERQAFNQQDLKRLDAHPDHISCSIEYPNAWYLRRRRSDAGPLSALFPDWVCLCVNASYLWEDATLFCPRNAAADRGRLVASGIDAFSSLYSERVTGAYNRVYTREQRPDACPTDEQAEVLVHRYVSLDDIQSVVVADESQAKRIFLGLRQLGVDDDSFGYVICPEFFDPDRLSAALRSGRMPVERNWEHRSLEDA